MPMPIDTNDTQRNDALLETGNRMTTLRKERSVTQDELGKRMGFNGNAVSRIENGRVNMRVTTYFDIVEILQVTPNEMCPRRLLAGTPLERYNELNRAGRDLLHGMIDVLLGEPGNRA